MPEDDQLNISAKDKITLLIFFVILLLFTALVVNKFFLHKPDSKIIEEVNNNIATTSDLISFETNESDKIKAPNQDTLDFDNDGLSDKEEEKYGTNPFEKDTDHDGYSDKTEIDGGFNPTGEGRLEDRVVHTEEGLKNPKSQNDCYQPEESRYDSICLKKFALETRNYNLCTKLSIGAKENCYRNIAVADNDLDGCAKIREGYVQENCYQDIALNTKNEKICANINRLKNRDFCLGGVASLKNDLNLCRQIKTLTPKDNCLKEIAKNNKDKNLCQEILDREKRDWCYYDLAEAQKNESLCEHIAEKRMYDHCYFKLAVLKTDKNLCEKMSTRRLVNDCYLKVLQTNKDGIGVKDAIKIKGTYLLKNIFKILIFIIIFGVVGIFVTAGVLNWSMIRQGIGNPSFETTLKITFIVNLISLIPGILKYIPSTSSAFSIFRALLSIIFFLFEIWLYNYLFKKWHRTSTSENLKIFILAIGVLFLLGVVFYILISVIFLFGGTFLLSNFSTLF